MRPGFLGTHIRQILVTALVCGASFGYIALTDDSVSQSTPVYAPAPITGPTSYHGPSVSRSESFGSSATPKLTHRSSISAGSSHTAAVPYSSKNAFSNVNQHSGMSGSYAVPLTSTANRTSSSSGGGGGGGAATGSTGSSVTILALATPRATSIPSMPLRAKSLNATLAGDNPYGSLDLYEGDKPGEITGDENKDLDNPIVDNLTEPLGDALLPLLLCVVLYLLCKRKPLPEVISCITSRGKHHNIS